MALTRRQREVLDVIHQFISEQGYSPSLQEIGEQLGLSSVATVHKHVSHLVQKGLVRRGWNQNRSIELVDGVDDSGVRQLPLLGSIAAGLPLEAVQTAETISVPTEMVRDPQHSYVLRVQGDSMIDEQIRDGDFVVIEQRQTARRGDTVVALVDGRDATLKQFYDEGETIRLQPAHPSMDPIRVPADRVAIQGVVIGVLRHY
ncbi:MAG: transcriptional repressor LexA [Acidobacteriota bacterium]|nr:transcriptional repressor LexA [Acidobacteriota bacterium]MDH3784832.1 transcriptional repressor LexA [Acidobacteriota bacterium]